MPSARIHHLDFLRSACILYIVGFWHMMEYWPASGGSHNWVTARLTTIALGLFTFLSGYLLGGKALSWQPASVRAFYIRRILRIYPLYLAALIAFGALGLATWRSVALSAVGVSPFLGQVPMTLWFVAMLLVFYLLAPVLITAPSRNSLAVRAAALFAVLVVAVRLLPDADARLVIYFPAFALGVQANRDVGPPSAGKLAVPLLLVVLFGAAGVLTGSLAWLWMAGLAASGALLLHRWAEVSGIARRPSAAVFFISTAAFVMYLSHRPILHLATGAFFPAGSSLQLLYLLGVCLPLIVGVSWLVQRGYDAAIRCFDWPAAAKSGGVGG